MKYFLSFLTAAAVMVTMFGNVCFSLSGESISAKSAVLIEAESGTVLFEKNSGTFMPMASTTKIMSALLTLESGSLDENFVVDSEAIKVEGSSMGLTEGDTVTRRTLCYGMLLPSGNDAANASAVSVSGSVESFVKLMNERAAEIGMKSTRFVTPSGLDGEGHGSTAYDMAILTAEALRNEDFALICSTASARLSYGNPPYERWLSNTNKLLKMYDGCIGVKTGFTDEAGRCLVSAAKRNGVTLICVTLNAPDDWNDHIKMFNYGFASVKLANLPVPEEMSVAVAGDGDSSSIPLIAAEMPQAAVAPADISRIEHRIFIPPFVYAPVAAGDRVGHIEYRLDGRLIESISLLAGEECGIRQTQSITDKIINIIKGEK